jgi:hypothetical protein
VSLTSQGEILDFWFKEIPPETLVRGRSGRRCDGAGPLRRDLARGDGGAFSSWANTMRVRLPRGDCPIRALFLLHRRLCARLRLKKSNF